MGTQENQDKQAESERRSSSTSPLDGRTDKATTPPGQGDLDKDAVDKGWEGLDRAGGGH